MKKKLPYFIVDVFAEQKYTGNQLAVFLDLDQQLSTAEMLAITREINFAESAFVRTREEDGAFGVRIFTPEYEVPFAGHPSLGSSYIIAKHVAASPSENLVLRLKKGDIPISIKHQAQLEQSRFTMQQAPPSFGPVFPLETISSLIGLPIEALDSSKPIEEVSTGLPYLIVFLKERRHIEMLSLNAAKIISFLKQHKLYKDNSPTKLTTSLFFVTSETVLDHTDYHARMFAIENGKLWEDAATGSANGCLLAYLLKHGSGVVSAVVEQGFEMGRKSILYLNGKRSVDSYILEVGGQIVPIAEGYWYP